MSEGVIDRLEEVRSEYVQHKQEALEDGDEQAASYFEGKQAAIIRAIEIVDEESGQA